MDLQHHQEVLELSRQLKEEGALRLEDTQRQFLEVADRCKVEEHKAVALSQKVEKQGDFLAGDTLMYHIKRVCSVALKDYVPWESLGMTYE